MLDSLIAIGGAVVAALAALWMAFTRGKKAEQKDQAQREVRTIEKANEVKRDVDSEPDPVQRLRDSWQRD